MKKIMTVLTVMMMSTMVSGCSSKAAAVPETETMAVLEPIVTEESQGESQEESQADQDEERAEGINADKGQTSGGEISGNSELSRTSGGSADGYEDNFAVEVGAAAEFADRIKSAVAAENLEALADLTAFPVYVSIAKDGVKTRDDFMALGAERVFTPELMASIKNADTTNLTPSMAGFVVAADGGPNIIFGVVDGKLAISGINY